MDVRKQANGNTRITLSDSELIDALETSFKSIYENITETGVIQKITSNYGRVEIIIGDKEE